MVVEKMSRRPIIAIAAFAVLIASLSRAQAVENVGEKKEQVDKALTRIDQIRGMSLQEASSSPIVTLHGRVLAMSGFHNFFFLQDATAAIAVDRLDDAVVHAGDVVTVEGTVQPGSFAPIVVASRVSKSRSARTPRVLRRTYLDLVGGSEDSQWVEVEGIVRSAGPSKLWTHDTIAFDLAMNGGSVKVHLQDYAGLDPQQLVDATIRVRGVCATNFNHRRQFVGLLLLVPNASHIDVLQHGPQDAFSMPSLPLRSVMQFNPVWRPGHRIKVEGFATYRAPDGTVFLQEGEDAVQVDTLDASAVPLGSYVEAVGFPVMGDYAPVLKDSSVRVKVAASKIAARPISVSQMFSQQLGFLQAPFDEHLVQIAADVVESHVEGNGRGWILREGNQTFTAHLQNAEQAQFDEATSAGSRLLLTGICKVHSNSSRTPVSFELLLRTPQDVLTLRKPSWWTSKRAFALTAILCGSVLLVLLWVKVLRRRVVEQTLLLRASEQRYREMAERDVLTGLPNRLFLEERASRCFTVCEEERVKVAVMTIDIDHFKNINDTYGHLVGDECLITVANRLKSKVRGVDTIARTGGEEFTLIVGRLNSESDAQKVCSALLQLFQVPIHFSEREFVVTVSIGVAMYPEDGTDFNVLRRESDKALYGAKRAGRNRSLFVSSMHAEESSFLFNELTSPHLQ